MLLININSFGNFCRRVGIDKLYIQAGSSRRQVRLQDIDREITANSSCHRKATEVFCSNRGSYINRVGHPVVRLRTGEDVFISHVYRKDCAFWATITPIGWNSPTIDKSRNIDMSTLHDEVVGRVIGVTYDVHDSVDEESARLGYFPSY